MPPFLARVFLFAKKGVRYVIISNKIIKDYYKKAMQEGDPIYREGNDKYLEILKEQYEINNARYSHS